MTEKEKARANGPIPNAVLADCAELNASLLTFQVARLTRRCAITVAMAAIVAPLIYRGASHE